MKNLASISIGLAVVGLALGHGLSLLWLWLVLGFLWLVGQRSRSGWSNSMGLLAFVGAAALGVWRGLPAGWLLVSTVAALAAWDLNHFARRMQQSGQEEIEPELERAHLQRLAGVTGLGLLLGGLALGLRLELTLGWAIFLGFLAILGLSRALGLIGGGGAGNDPEGVSSRNR